jgi:rhamnosyl/mannosyltransferase
MRVLHVYRTFFPDTQGGLEEVIRQICKNTQNLGVENRVFCLSHQPEPAVIDYEGIPVYRVQNHLEIASCGFSFSALTVFKAQVAWAEVIHYQFPWPFADVLHWIGWVKKPAVITYESDIVRQKGFLRLYRPLKRLFLNQMKTIVATSPNYAKTSAVLQRYADKVQVIPIGIDEKSYPMATAAQIKTTCQKVGTGFFLFIGVLRYYKGLHLLLEAALKMNARIIIAGSGPEEIALKAQAKTLGLNNVRFLGQVSNEEKVALIKLSLAIVFPSHLRSEAFGVTLLEAAMMAKPMISCELGTGTSYVNAHHETGLVITPNNPEKLRDAMQQLLDKPRLVKQFGLKARARYETLFTGQKMGEHYAALYQTVLLK